MKIESLLSPEMRESLKKERAKQKKEKPWNWRQQCLSLVEVTGFEAMHLFGHNGSNNENGLVSLVTTYREAEIMRASMRKGVLEVHLRYDRSRSQGYCDTVPGIESGHGYGIGWGRAVIYISNGKKTEEIFLREGDSTERDHFPHKLQGIIGDVAAKRIGRDELDYVAKHWRERGLRESSDLASVLNLAGYKIVDAFEYSERVTISPSYIKAEGYRVEVGFQTNHTYHSLPRVVVFDLLPDLKTVELGDLGIEDGGYYTRERGDGSNRSNHSIVKADVRKAQLFAQQFLRNEQAYVRGEDAKSA